MNRQAEATARGTQGGRKGAEAGPPSDWGWTPELAALAHPAHGVEPASGGAISAGDRRRHRRRVRVRGGPPQNLRECGGGV